MAELSDIRETVREKYAAAAEATSASAEAGCCEPGSLACSPADEEGLFGGALYGETSPTSTRARRFSTSARAPEPTC